MSPSDASLSADALDHLVQPAPPSAAERRGLAIAVIAAAAMHLVIPLALLIFYWLSPAPAPPVEEIPVEVVVEPPPPPPKPKEQPKPPPQREDERPAYDAPSAATQEKANRESRDEKTTAPAHKPELSQNAGAPQQSEQPPAAEERKAQSPPPPEMQRAPDAEQPAAPSSSPAEADATPPAETVEPKPAPPPAPPAKAPPGVPVPDADELPTYQFAHAATESPVIGGNADTRYFTIVYGMIRSHFRPPNIHMPPRGGAIVFTVDESGNLVQRKLIASSGSPNLDIAVMTAIAEASPYPAPPDWQPRSMRLVYGR
ncbi:MAG TPA: TonB family protein [Roseiarcus sp.]|jgi:protein TonB|nr:TonB family protein [Roseiarcus sp.]